MSSGGGVQPSMRSFMERLALPAFGSFSDAEGHGGAVPSDRYLSAMLVKAIELETDDADQHTSCLPIDILALDDSYKVCIVSSEAGFLPLT